VRVIAANPVTRDQQAPLEEWLIAEWPEAHDAPSDYWISNLPADTEPEQLARRRDRGCWPVGAGAHGLLGRSCPMLLNAFGWFSASRCEPT
jgi:hypothetical protein